MESSCYHRSVGVLLTFFYHGKTHCLNRNPLFRTSPSRRPTFRMGFSTLFATKSIEMAVFTTLRLGRRVDASGRRCQFVGKVETGTDFCVIDALRNEKFTELQVATTLVIVNFSTLTKYKLKR